MTGVQACALPISAVFEEVAFAVEQAIREGRTDIAIDTFGALIARESGASDAEVRRYYVLAVRRLTKPVMLTPIARAVVDTPAKAAEAEAILTRCGTDGVDAVADQYTRARTISERTTFRALLDRLPAADAGLIAMMADTRPAMSRIAAELLGERRALDGDRAHWTTLVAAYLVPATVIATLSPLMPQRRWLGLLAVVQALPEQDRRCLYLRAEGLRYRDITEVLGMSLGAVAQSLARSLERLHRADFGELA